MQLWALREGERALRAAPPADLAMVRKRLSVLAEEIPLEPRTRAELHQALARVADALADIELVETAEARRQQAAKDATRLWELQTLVRKASARQGVVLVDSEAQQASLERLRIDPTNPEAWQSHFMHFVMRNPPGFDALAVHRGALPRHGFSPHA